MCFLKKIGFHLWVCAAIFLNGFQSTQVCAREMFLGSDDGFFNEQDVFDGCVGNVEESQFLQNQFLFLKVKQHVLGSLFFSLTDYSKIKINVFMFPFGYLSSEDETNKLNDIVIDEYPACSNLIVSRSKEFALFRTKFMSKTIKIRALGCSGQFMAWPVPVFWT